MTWLDVLLIVVMLVFLAAGARAGSLWMAACLVGGFLGSFLVDTYTLPVAEMVGGFSGATWFVGFLLYAGGVFCSLLIGHILSQIFSGLLLGTVDSVMGLLTAGAAGILGILVCMMLLLPHFPWIESKPAWAHSLLVKPLHNFGENVFNNPRFQQKSFVGTLGTEAQKALTPAATKAEEKVKDLAHTLSRKLKR
jgi:uncharacterized membrane protein required for colicin V production